MEYFIGSIITLVTIIIVNRFIRRENQNSLPSVRYSQSHVYNIVGHLLPTNYEIKQSKPTQSKKYLNEMTTKIMFVESKAYWIRDNSLFVADVFNGEVKKETTVQVDTMTMSRVELDKIKIIVEKLTGGN